ncbi:Translation initiation factor [Trichinella spiralis]|uniref:Translation initiation factor n=1 Tax=Trichinella spiralis TaxID=6334 RepID=A0ABR3K8M2_TRISP
MKVEKQEAGVLLCTWTGKRTAGGVGPAATVGRVKVSRRVSVTSAFGQGTAGKGNRANMAAPLTPAYGHCIAARPDSDRRPRYGRAATTTTKD